MFDPVNLGKFGWTIGDANDTILLSVSVEGFSEAMVGELGIEFFGLTTASFVKLISRSGGK